MHYQYFLQPIKPNNICMSSFVPKKGVFGWVLQTQIYDQHILLIFLFFLFNDSILWKPFIFVDSEVRIRLTFLLPSSKGAVSFIAKQQRSLYLWCSTRCALATGTPESSAFIICPPACLIFTRGVEKEKSNCRLMSFSHLEYGYIGLQKCVIIVEVPIDLFYDSFWTVLTFVTYTSSHWQYFICRS